MNIADAIVSAKVRKFASLSLRALPFIRAAPQQRDLSASGHCRCGDLVVSGVDNLIALNLWSSLNHSRQELQHVRIGCAVIGCGVFFVIPQADSNRFRSVPDDEYDFVLETFLLSEEGNDPVLNRAGKLRNAIGLENHRNLSGKHVNLAHTLSLWAITGNHPGFRRLQPSSPIKGLLFMYCHGQEFLSGLCPKWHSPLRKLGVPNVTTTSELRLTATGACGITQVTLRGSRWDLYRRRLRSIK